MTWIATVSNVAMAIGPPLAYLDQFIHILSKRNSSGFSIDTCGVLIIANVTRCFYWLGYRFETALLVQSLLMLLAQFSLLYVCLLYRPTSESPTDNAEAQHEDAAAHESLIGKHGPPHVMGRPGNFWQWASFGSYLEFTAALILFHTVVFFLLHSFIVCIDLIGFIALGLEATLPIPQLVVNYHRKSTAGFRHSVLVLWAGGDFAKTLYFFINKNNTALFKGCAVFQLSIDCMLIYQTYLYRQKTAQDLKALNLEAGVAGADPVL